MKLNARQQQVVETSGHLVAAAPPGSGKTRVLVERTKRLIKEGNGTIRLVTFTRNAAAEMKRRIGAAGRSMVTAATFDSYCLKMARQADRRIKPPSAIQDLIAKQQTLRELNLNMQLEDLEELLAGARSLLVPANAPIQLSATAYKVYQQKLQEQGAFDFSGIARGVVNEIMKPDGRIRPLPTAHLLVDEFQDSDQIQLAWVLAHARAGAEVLVVGDDDQAIYSWRGGMGYQAMKEVETQLKAKVIMLDTCYRCRPEVVEHARMLISHNKKRFVKPTRTPRPCGGQVQWWQLKDPGAGEFCIRTYLEYHDWPKFAILARRNRDLDAYEEALVATGKRILRLGGQSLWSKPGAQAVLDLARAIPDPDKAKSQKHLKTVMGWMKFTQDQQAQVVEAIKQHVPLDDGRLNEAKSVQGQFVDLVNRCRGMHDGEEGAAQVALEIKNFIADRQSQNWPTHKAALAAAKVLGRRARMNPHRTLTESVGDLTNAAYSGKEEQEADGVLATMHASKGMEFPVVFIVGANDGISPNERASDDPEGDLMEEERRLFFVALTRAENEAYIISYQADGRKGLLPSPFVAEARAPAAPMGELLESWGVERSGRLWRDLGIVAAGRGRREKAAAGG